MRSQIPRKRVTSSFSAWLKHMPKPGHAKHHLERILESAPREWQAAIRARYLKAAPQPPAGVAMDPDAYARWSLQQPSENEQAWRDLQELADYEDRYGDALRLNMQDSEICAWAKKLADDVEELENMCIAMGGGLCERLDLVRGIVRVIGVEEDKPINSEPAIARAKCARWWRRRLRRHVARVVEAGAIGMGLVHSGSGGYISHSGLQRRKGQLARNAEALGRTLYRNEAGQVWTLAELAKLGTSNPTVRGGELMTRIRGAEEYADARAHVGLFLTLTLPSRFHPVKLVGSARRPVPNIKYAGATPREGQQWLCETWSRVRASLERQGIKRYGLRVAEPHHDATPHWHMLLWVEDEAQAQALEATVRKYWLSDDGDERGARENRVCIKRMTAGGAAGYVAKYIAKSVGHHALAEHKDVVLGEKLTLDMFGSDSKPSPAPQANDMTGHRRVDAWASTWGIRQFQAFGMPSVTVWRELRRVSKDQLELWQREGEWDGVRAYQACHRHGNMRADWRMFMEAMGGHACKRGDWLLCPARRTLREGATNVYGDPLKAGRIVGLTPQRGRMYGRWLVSRRIAWRPYLGEAPSTAAEGADASQAQGSGQAPQRQALPAAWTGFNNCTARLTGQLHRQIFGCGRHEPEDWCSPDSPDSVLYQPKTQPQTMADRFQQAAHFFKNTH